jgi:hypothetical protein
MTSLEVRFQKIEEEGTALDQPLKKCWIESSSHPLENQGLAVMSHRLIVPLDQTLHLPPKVQQGQTHVTFVDKRIILQENVPGQELGHRLLRGQQEIYTSRGWGSRAFANLYHRNTKGPT